MVGTALLAISHATNEMMSSIQYKTLYESGKIVLESLYQSFRSSMRFALKTAAVTSYFYHISLYFDSEVQITPMKYLIMFRNSNHKYFGSSNFIRALIEVKVQSIHYCQKHP